VPVACPASLEDCACSQCRRSRIQRRPAWIRRSERQPR